MQGNQVLPRLIYDQSDEDALNRLEKMGIVFHDADIQNGDWIEIDERNKRKHRKKQASQIDVKAKTMIKKSTKDKTRI